MLPEPIFIRVFDANSDGSLEHTITTIQNAHHTLMKEWEGTFPIKRVDTPCHRRCSESLDCSDCCVKSSTIELKSQEVFLRPYADAWKTVSATGSREGEAMDW